MERILITGTGGDVAAGIVQCFLDISSQVTLFSCDIKSIVPYCDRFKKHFIVPRYDDTMYFNSIQKICLKHNITHFFPTTEPEIIMADNNRGFFEDHNIKLLINNSLILDVVTSKYKTYNFLKNNNIIVPETYLAADLPKSLDYPLIVKPDFGRGSNYVKKVNNHKELQDAVKLIPSPVVQRYVGTEEQEFTVGVFSDGKNIRSILFRRKLGRGNMSVYVEVVQDPTLEDIVHKVALLFNLSGSFNIQLRLYNNIYYIFEINPRISSTVSFRHMMGFKDVLWWFQLVNGERVDDYIEAKTGIIGIKVDSEQIFYPPFMNIEKS